MLHGHPGMSVTGDAQTCHQRDDIDGRLAEARSLSRLTAITLGVTAPSSLKISTFTAESRQMKATDAPEAAWPASQPRPSEDPLAARGWDGAF